MKILMKKEILILFIIFLLALFLRLYRLGEIPHGFHADEVMNGYVGRYILLNGKDLYGNSWPLLYFNRFGDYPPVIPMYLSGLATFIFGVNEFAVRFPSAFLGALVVFPIYFLGKLIFREKKTALIASLFVTLLPWHVVLSRATSEGIMGLTVFSFALWLLLEGVSHLKKSLMLLSLLLFFLTYFLYPSFRILTPLALLPIPFLIAKKEDILARLLLAIFFFGFLTFWISSREWGRGRFLQTSLFHNEEISLRIKSSLEALSFDEGPGKIALARIFHNKPIAYGQEFIRQYLSYFSPEFLFTKGGLPSRYVVPEKGLFYLTFFLLIVFSLLSFNKKVNKPFAAYLLCLLLVAPLPAALTIDDAPNIHRAVLLILPLVLISAAGFSNITNLGYGKILVGLIFFLILAEAIYFFHQYFRHTASFKSILRNDGNREVIFSLKEKERDFQKIVMPPYDTLPLYYLFFTNNFDPSFAGKFRRNLEIDRAGNVDFLKDWCPTKQIKKGEIPPQTLIIERGDCEGTTGFKGIEFILRKDSTQAFKLSIPEK